MDPNTYIYNYQPRQRSPGAVSSRSSGAYQNSSAFSASANPDEDWTKISDLAERRRIQNRIAQRNYRKKLKRRLEEIERRNTSSSASPEQFHQELARPSANEHLSAQQTIQRRVSAPRATASHYDQHYSSDAMSSEEAWMNQMSNTKSTFPFSAPSTYSLPPSHSSSDYFPEDFNSSGLTRLPMMYTNQPYTADYIESISQPMPSVVPPDGFKSQQQYVGNELMTSFNMSYASLAGFNMPSTQGTPDFASRTPPLTAPSLHYDPTDCSPPQFTLPMTPESQSASPNIVLFDHIEL